MNTRIIPVSKWGVMIVYRREWIDPGRKRYVVIRDTDGRALEEFRQLRSAEKWAKDNSKG